MTDCRRAVILQQQAYAKTHDSCF